MKISESTPSKAVGHFPVDKFAINGMRNTVEGSPFVAAIVKDLRLQNEMDALLDGFAKAS